MITLDEFIKKYYPIPKKKDIGYNFYLKHGYNEYLIKYFKKDLEHIKNILLPHYLNYLLEKEVKKHKNLENYLIGKKIVKSKHFIFLLQGKISKDTYGILLRKIEDKYFCLFINTGSRGFILDIFSDEDIEITEEVFKSFNTFLLKLNEGR
ncbi:MAG: hypothetical protein KatS3mg002_0991 [Candidatus Woesearchaeota archaeon]|jgi:hypothetical protein|nr:MAG: hypothetical protein KatS3mg002_0991 [Candidatus Woesearchaeota archaeon]